MDRRCRVRGHRSGREQRHSEAGWEQSSQFEPPHGQRPALAGRYRVVRRAGVLFIMALAVGFSSAGCGSGVHQGAGVSQRPGARRQAAPSATLNRIAALCAQARANVTAIPKANHSNSAALRYVARVARVLDRLSADIMAAAESGRASSSLKSAIAVEDRGEKLVDAQIPALEHHDLARAQQLAARARELTAPADVVLRHAGLGICAGQ
jgi:hypothetical protein